MTVVLKGKLSFHSKQNHLFTYNEKMTVESVTQSVSNLALSFGDDDADAGAMVRQQWNLWCQRQQIPENLLERDIHV